MSNGTIASVRATGVKCPGLGSPGHEQKFKKRVQDVGSIGHLRSERCPDQVVHQQGRGLARAEQDPREQAAT